MTFVHGKSTAVLYGSANMSPYLNSASINSDVEASETSVFGQNDKTYIVGLADAKMSFGGLFDGSTAAPATTFESALKTTDNVVTVAHGGLTLGNRAWMGAVQEVTYSVEAPVADVVKTSFDLQIDGAIDSGIILAAARSSATATTLNETGVQGATSTHGGVGHLHVTANANGGTTGIKIQDSADDITYGDLITFTTVGVTSKTSERVELGNSVAVDQYVRATATTASTGAIVYSVAFARR